MILFLPVIAILAIVIISLIAFKIKKIEKTDKEARKDIIINISITTIFVSVLIIITLFVFMSDNYTYVSTEVKEEIVYEIEAIQDNNSFSRRFFLGTGTVNSGLKYYVMAKRDSGMILKELNPKRTFIVEDDDRNPQYVLRETYKISKKNDNFLTWILKPISNFFEEFKVVRTSRDAVLYIPSNSILNDYNIDLQ